MKKYLTLFYLTGILLILSLFMQAYADTYINGGLGEEWGRFSGAVNAGYNLSPYLGLEGGVTTSDSGYGIIDAAVKGTLPLSRIFSLYGRAGLAGNLYDLNAAARPIDPGVGVLLGVGAKFNLSRNWALTLEDYGVSSGPNFLMAGAQFNF